MLLLYLIVVILVILLLRERILEEIQVKHALEKTHYNSKNLKEKEKEKKKKKNTIKNGAYKKCKPRVLDDEKVIKNRTLSNIDDEELENVMLEKRDIQKDAEDMLAAEVRESITRLYLGDSCLGDRKLLEKNQDMSIKNKMAIDARAMWHKNSFLPYLEEELRSCENQHWWESDY